MKTCPYCATVLKYSLCSFCGYQGEGNENGNRSTKCVIRNFFSLDQAIQKLEVLEKNHTYDLMYGLKLVRAERSQAFNILSSTNNLLKKVDDTNKVEFQKIRDEAGKQYEYWTKKAWVLENILTDRLGYFPERIEEEMLQRVKELSQKVTTKQMGFGKSKKVSK